MRSETKRRLILTLAMGLGLPTLVPIIYAVHHLAPSVPITPVVTCLFGGCLILLALLGLRVGALPGQGTPCTRAETPVRFWLSFFWLLALGLFVAMLGFAVES